MKNEIKSAKRTPPLFQYEPLFRSPGSATALTTSCHFLEDAVKLAQRQKTSPQKLFLTTPLKVRKTAKIRKRHNQVPHLTHDTTWESKQHKLNITNKSQGVSPFPAQDSTEQTRMHDKHKTKITQMIHKRRTAFQTVSKNMLLEGLNRFHCANLTFNPYLCII